ncbi:OmpA family protein [Pseudenhygromyxa sp. WMMC2535]|nr:OmpA family protein [Pseudenhygromyxa sp. WMMC2535]NVB41278.1 OmpA family protein [Pseudenhygromyxa sp. WMMC2535]
MQVTAVVVDAGIIEACGIQSNNAYFDYDSAKLDPATRALLSEIADCFDDGPLAGEGLELIGHADPRGSDEYNLELGESRAQSVARVLIANGMSPTHVEVESQGEALAHEDPERWPEDRRVDVRLGS